MLASILAATLVSATLADVSKCVADREGKTTPCRPGHQTCPPVSLNQYVTAPQFHVKDASCGENDPNGPSYDPVHGMYHLHYQNHVGLHGGRTYGHAVSKDLIHWAHMPISVWNDQPYDSRAIWTGSATIVNGSVVQVYPGLCEYNKTHPSGCPGGTNLCIAVPEDASDPLQTNWTKTAWFKGTNASNPIVNSTGRDPSSAWKTASGEWQLTTFDTVIYGSMDFRTWYKVGHQDGFPSGECPSFFELPAATPGARAAPEGAPAYTHVHKRSYGGQDWMQVGTYTSPTAPKTNGKWVGATEVMIDSGTMYASKDFFDPVKKRRINWGWARQGPSCISSQTLPREVTWHPELQQLVHSPLEEQNALRGDVLGKISAGTSIRGPQDILDGKHSKDAGRQAEIRVSFARPAAPARLSVTVMDGREFVVQYDGNTNTTATCSCCPKCYTNNRTSTYPKMSKLNLLDADTTIDMTLYVLEKGG